MLENLWTHKYKCAGDQNIWIKVKGNRIKTNSTVEMEQLREMDISYLKLPEAEWSRKSLTTEDECVL